MLTKDSFMSSCNRLPFTKTTVDGIGEVGLVLFREGEFDELKELDAETQIAKCIISDKGERVFSDQDVVDGIIKKMPIKTRNDIIHKVFEVNGLLATQEEIKKN